MTNPIIQNSFSLFINWLKNYKTDFDIPLISEWAKSRWMPAGQTEYPGYIDHDIAPHLVEIQDCFHPDNDVEEVDILKSTQSLSTTMIENVIGHSIRYGLHNILYVISSKSVGKMRSSAAIDVMIDNSGLIKYIKPLSQRMLRKTADTAMYKEFRGGRRFLITSYKSIADLKSFSYDLIVMDEIDEAGLELKGQGDPEGIIEARATTIRNAKTCKLGTPTEVATSRIDKNFKQSDMRYFNVKCPECGQPQVLVLYAQGRKYGLRGLYEKDSRGHLRLIPDTVKYVCQHCREDIYEYQKQYMMQNGLWLPTAESVSSKKRGYHISGLMSPIMFLTWDKVIDEFVKTDFGENLFKFKNYVITVLGEAWENRTEKKSWKALAGRRDVNSEPGIVPEGFFLITGGVDVHPDRLEIQLVAWRYGMECCSFDWKVFRGDTSILDGPAWVSLLDYCFKLRKIKNGPEIMISKIAIDTGHNPGEKRAKDYGQKAHVVYNFVAMYPELFIAVRGHDNENQMLIKEVRTSGNLKKRYDVSVSLIKESIIKHIDLEDGPYAVHFVNYKDEFFRQFLSENYAEIGKGKWGWKKIYERNETWDTFIYGWAAAEVQNISSWSSVMWKEYEDVIKSP